MLKQQAIGSINLDKTGRLKATFFQHPLRILVLRVGDSHHFARAHFLKQIVGQGGGDLRGQPLPEKPGQQHIAHFQVKKWFK